MSPAWRPFAGGAAAFTLNGPFSLAPGGTFTSTSGTFAVSGNFTDTGGTFSAGGGTVSFGGAAATIDVAASESFNNLIFAAGTKTISAGDTLTATGSVALTGGALNGTGTLAAQGRSARPRRTPAARPPCSSTGPGRRP